MILNARFDSRSVDLFNTLDWIDFLFIGRNTPNYINELLVANSSVHMRNTRYCNLNLLSPGYNYATEGGGSFTFRSIKDWNSIL